jgi:hypothetical protein
MVSLPHLEQVEFRDLQITLFEFNGAYWIVVDRWQDNVWLRVGIPVQARNSDHSTPTLHNGLCRKLWDIYGKRMDTQETKP